MFLTICNVLEASDLAGLTARLQKQEWRSGDNTAGAIAKSAKNNLQARLHDKAGMLIHDEILSSLKRNTVLNAAALPHKYSRLLVSKMGVGQSYGLHTDNAFMGAGQSRLRTDMSFTLFLNDPQEYDGGVLEITDASGTRSAKLDAGSLVLYPSTSIHQVTPVKNGEHLVCAGWIESVIRSPLARETLFDLQNLRYELAQKQSVQSQELLVLSKAISNLMRLHG